MAEIFVGRQPIYTRDLDVYAYELMSHPANQSTTDSIDSDKATSQVIINAFMEIGIDKLVGNRYIQEGKLTLKQIDKRIDLDTEKFKETIKEFLIYK